MWQDNKTPVYTHASYVHIHYASVAYDVSTKSANAGFNAKIHWYPIRRRSENDLSDGVVTSASAKIPKLTSARSESKSLHKRAVLIQFPDFADTPYRYNNYVYASERDKNGVFNGP